MRKTIIVLLLALYLSVQVQAADNDFDATCTTTATCVAGKAGANSKCVSLICACNAGYYANLFHTTATCQKCPDSNAETAADNKLKTCSDCKSGFTKTGTPAVSTTMKDAVHATCTCTDAKKYDKAGVCTACGDDATRHATDGTKCACDTTKTKALGYYLNSANACVACYANSEPNTAQTACACKTGFTANTAKSACAATTTSADMLKPFLAVFAVIFALLLA